MIRELNEKQTPFLGYLSGTTAACLRAVRRARVWKVLVLLKGKIRRIPDKKGLKIPHIGWNSLDFHNNGRLFAGHGRSPVCIFCTFLLSACRGSGYCKGNYGVQHLHPCIRGTRATCLPASSTRRRAVLWDYRS